MMSSAERSYNRNPLIGKIRSIEGTGYLAVKKRSPDFNNTRGSREQVIMRAPQRKITTEYFNWKCERERGNTELK